MQMELNTQLKCFTIKIKEMKEIEEKLEYPDGIQIHSDTEETKLEILERIVNLTDSSFVDDNYTDYTIHKLFEDTVEFAMDELDDNGIDYTEKEIRDYFECKI